MIKFNLFLKIKNEGHFLLEKSIKKKMCGWGRKGVGLVMGIFVFSTYSVRLNLDSFKVLL